MLLETATASVQAQYVYTTLSVPGAQRTCAMDISGNDIVGYYYNGSTLRGISLQWWRLYHLERSGSKGTLMLLGISGNNIVGRFLQSLGAYFSPLYDGSTYTHPEHSGS